MAGARPAHARCAKAGAQRRTAGLLGRKRVEDRRGRRVAHAPHVGGGFHSARGLGLHGMRDRHQLGEPADPLGRLCPQETHRRALPRPLASRVAPRPFA